LQYLRKLCNHPALVLEGQSARYEEIRQRTGGGSIRDISNAPKLEALR
jgi:TATA-binding protein-associated factor